MMERMEAVSILLEEIRVTEWWMRKPGQDGDKHCEEVAYKTRGNEKVEACRLAISALQQRERLVDALKLILPMAKGYAYEHNVGSNQKYVLETEQLLAEIKEDR
jgi:hypothetical protein